MRIDILTLFPDTVNAVLHESIIGRAAKKGIVEINCVQIRDYTDNKQNQVDDYPYGGGYGCVMMAQPLKSCLEHVLAEAGERRRRVIYMSPQGRPYDQETAKRLRRDYDHLVLVCGHYEGVDERFINPAAAGITLTPPARCWPAAPARSTASFAASTPPAAGSLDSSGAGMISCFHQKRKDAENGNAQRVIWFGEYGKGSPTRGLCLRAPDRVTAVLPVGGEACSPRAAA